LREAEGDAAIQGQTMDCFATLAMTGENLLSSYPQTL
jgi:hypothetical protein